MQIEVIDVGSITNETAKNGKTYKSFDLVYKNLSFDGKVETKKINTYSDQPFKVLSKAEKGDVFTVEREKNEAGFWNWNTVTAGKADPEPSAPPTLPSGGKKVVGSNYETSEERDWYRTRSFRSYSVSQAISILKVEKSVPSWEDVQAMAAQIEQWVTRRDVMKEIVNMEDDIPM